MQVTPRDRIVDIQPSLTDARRSSRGVTVLIPSFSNINYDKDTQTGNDVSSGDGTGRTIVWAIHKLLVHIRPVSQSLVTHGPVPPGVEEGDTLVYAGPRDRALLQKALTNEHSYVVIDGVTLRVVSLAVSGIGYAEEYIAVVKKYLPLYRAAGY